MEVKSRNNEHLAAQPPNLLLGGDKHEDGPVRKPLVDLARLLERLLYVLVVGRPPVEVHSDRVLSRCDL